MTYQVNANVHTKCPKSEDGKHKFERYSISGIPECTECGVLADKS